MKATLVVGTLCLMAMASGASFAQSSTPRVDAREKAQKERIKEGIKSGDLTRQEAHRLVAEQKKIRGDEARAKADGKVTGHERAKLNKEQNRASRDISRQKHDNQKRK